MNNKKEQFPVGTLLFVRGFGLGVIVDIQIKTRTATSKRKLRIYSVDWVNAEQAARSQSYTNGSIKLFRDNFLREIKKNDNP